MYKAELRRLLLVFAILGGYGWLLVTTLTPSLPSPDRPLVFYSNQLRDDLKLVVLRAIAHAKHSLTIQIYSLTDPDVIAALKKALTRGVDIQLFYDPTASTPFPRGHPVKAGGLMHRKILVVDGELALVGSANFTTSSLNMHRNLVVGLYGAEIATHLANSIQQSQSFAIGTTQLKSFFLPDFEGKALEELCHFLERASTSIQISLFTFTHPQILDALLRAKQRGIAVTVALDGYTARGSSLNALLMLREAGIRVLTNGGTELLHHKWALIDQKHLIMGSANWTKAAFEKNQDLLLFFEDLAEQDVRKMGKLWRAIELTAKRV